MNTCVNNANLTQLLHCVSNNIISCPSRNTCYPHGMKPSQILQTCQHSTNNGLQVGLNLVVDIPQGSHHFENCSQFQFPYFQLKFQLCAAFSQSILDLGSKLTAKFCSTPHQLQILS